MSKHFSLEVRALLQPARIVSLRPDAGAKGFGRRRPPLGPPTLAQSTRSLHCQLQVFKFAVCLGLPIALTAYVVYYPQGLQEVIRKVRPATAGGGRVGWGRRAGGWAGRVAGKEPVCLCFGEGLLILIDAVVDCHVSASPCRKPT